MSDSRRGFGLEIGFIDHFNTRIVTPFNYSAVANFHTLLSTFTSRFRVTDLNNGNSSTAPTMSFVHRLRTILNSCFHCPPPRHGRTENTAHQLLLQIVSMGTCLFAKALPSNGSISYNRLWAVLINWYSGGWSPIGSTRHCGHPLAYCASPG
jgi:hypothetical protein